MTGVQTCALPICDAPFFDEKIVYLPDCYQANDDKRAIGIVPTRESCGLPEDAVVFASFNNSYKYTPALFDVWMRILNKVPGSVLWLLESNRGMAANLRREAQSRGVTPERLVFAPSIATEDHLARQSLANIFLDALPYNAHTTASDALWAGLPVVTCKGSTFPGRVASSLLETMGMGELVTATVTEYEALASRLGNDKDAISALKTKLRECRALSPLFQTERFTRHLEAAYRKMWERHQNGLTPESFSLAPHV